MSKQANYTTPLYIPAYSAKNHALLVTLSLSATPHPAYIVQTHDDVAKTLKRALTRAIHIMSNLNPGWSSLLLQHYQLSAHETNFLVKDTRSAGLPIVISLLNLYRLQQQKAPVTSLIGTGVLRIDGSFDTTYKEDIKKTAINNQTLITANTCKHVFELNYFMEKINAEENQ
jgi:hypothetical protein